MQYLVFKGKNTTANKNDRKKFKITAVLVEYNKKVEVEILAKKHKLDYHL